MSLMEGLVVGTLGGRDWTDRAPEERLQGVGDPEPSHPGGGGGAHNFGVLATGLTVGRWVTP